MLNKITRSLKITVLTQKNYKDIQYNEQYLDDITESISLLSVQNTKWTNIQEHKE